MIVKKLSIFEFGLIDPINNIYPRDVVNWIFKFSKKLDDFEFNRLWLSEHYLPHFAWFSPQILIGLLAGSTNRIKIGQAGVIMNFHSPLVIAQNYKLLNSIFPERIDLGIAFGKVDDDVSRLLFNKNHKTDTHFWHEQLNSLFKLIRSQPFKESNFFNKVLIPPRTLKGPDIWFLGERSIDDAVRYNGNLCLSTFHSGLTVNDSKLIFEKFCRKYKFKHKTKPETILGIKAICSDKPEIIKFHIEQNISEEINRKMKIPIIAGDIEQCKIQLINIFEQTNCDEILLINSFSNLDQKNKSAEWFNEIIIQINNTKNKG